MHVSAHTFALALFFASSFFKFLALSRSRLSPLDILALFVVELDSSYLGNFFWFYWYLLQSIIQLFITTFDADSYFNKRTTILYNTRHSPRNLASEMILVFLFCCWYVQYCTIVGSAQRFPHRPFAHYTRGATTNTKKQNVVIHSCTMHNHEENHLFWSARTIGTTNSNGIDSKSWERKWNKTDFYSDLVHNIQDSWMYLIKPLLLLILSNLKDNKMNKAYHTTVTL